MQITGPNRTSPPPAVVSDVTNHVIADELEIELVQTAAEAGVASRAVATPIELGISCMVALRLAETMS